ncbi:MAG: hypothetical protein E5V36_02125 [Mesorhizobium sp.]|nr:MAG: hypothetical protein E5V36_02125 [Mesorhizobium sp.]
MQDPAIADELARVRALAKGLHIDRTPALVVGDIVIAELVDMASLQRLLADARSKRAGSRAGQHL